MSGWHRLQESNSDTIIRAAVMYDYSRKEDVTDFVIVREDEPGMFEHVIITSAGDELVRDKIHVACWQRFMITGSLASRIIAEQETVLSVGDGLDYGFRKERLDIVRALQRSSIHLPTGSPRKSSYPDEAIAYMRFVLSTGWTPLFAAIADSEDFPRWYADETTFHPAFQIMYDLASGQADGMTDGKSFNRELDQVLVSLFSCLVS